MTKRSSPPLSKAAALRRLLARPGPIVLGGAHDGLTSRIVEEAGYDAVWASGFEISASYAVPDASILTMTETLHAAQIMNEATSLPVMADCDTGFGNSINAIRTVPAFAAPGIASICIEANVFPKRCSFYGGVKRLLTDTDEQVLKIKSAGDAAPRELRIGARNAALIAGWGHCERRGCGPPYREA